MFLIRRENVAHRADVFRTAFIGTRPHLEFSGQRVERDGNGVIAIILVLDGDAFHDRQQRSQTLLPINHQIIRSLIGLIILADMASTFIILWRFPEHDITNGKSLQHGIKQFPDLVILPNKGPLKIRQTDPSVFHVLNQIANPAGDIGVKLLAHSCIPPYSS